MPDLLTYASDEAFRSSFAATLIGASRANSAAGVAVRLINPTIRMVRFELAGLCSGWAALSGPRDPRISDLRKIVDDLSQARLILAALERGA